MGLQLEGYGSDSDSEASDSPASSKATDFISQQNSVGPAIGLPIQTKRKVPVKIGLNHPILRKVDEELSLPIESEDVVSVSAKRSRASQAFAGEGRSGLLDLLPPPKKRVQTKQSGGITRKDNCLPVGSGLAHNDITKPFEDLPKEDSSAITTARLAPPQNGSAEPNFDLFGLGKPWPILANRLTLTLKPCVAPTNVSTSLQNPAVPESGLQVRSAPETENAIMPGVNIPPSQNIPDHSAPRADLIAAGAMGHAWKDVQNHEIAGLASWDVREGLAEARKTEEERAKLTAPPAYNEPTNYKVSRRKMLRLDTSSHPLRVPSLQPAGRTNGLAGKRHQLSALLQDAQSNRQALEDRIAENKRTKRAAGSKYGF